jgi:hypothetical protein
MSGHVQDELPALLSGELSPAQAAAVHVHLAGCDRCRADLAAVAFATGELRATARLPFADPAELPPLLLAPPADVGEKPPGEEPELTIDLPAGAGQRVGPAAVVLAATDDGLDPVYQATRQAAFAVAAREGARLVLFDRSPELYLVDPYERAPGARCTTSGRPVAWAGRTWPTSSPRPISSASTGPPGWPAATVPTPWPPPARSSTPNGWCSRRPWLSRP